ncbi:MAG: hypothetical protein IT280_00090 [Ignavibacteria bacterium]|nr:hypothetical protein [Ignavibacteria bacterium]
MGKWTREFSRQIFGGKSKRQSAGQRYIKRSANRIRRQQRKQMRRAKSLFNSCR